MFSLTDYYLVKIHDFAGLKHNMGLRTRRVESFFVRGAYDMEFTVSYAWIAARNMGELSWRNVTQK